MNERAVHTHCRICASSCGVKVTVDVDANTIARIGPDKENPYTWKDFCAKGRTAGDILHHPRRVLHPMRRVGDRYEQASWEEAYADIAARVNRIIERDGPDAIGSYHGNPTATATATAMFFPGLMDAIGSGNRFWVGSVDQNNVHVVSEKLYGVPLLVLTPDVDHSDCFLLVGTNPEASGMHWVDVVPDGWSRILAAKQRGADLIMVDPRRTESAEHATTHVAIRPGGDWAFLLGVLKVILDNGWVATGQRPAISGVEEIHALTGGVELAHLAARAGIEAEVIEDVARRFATAKTGLCITRTGVAQTVSGTVSEWLSHVLNHVTGRVDVPGGRTFERSYVNGVRLWDKFAPPATHRTRLRGLPPVAGFHSVAELADEITTPGRGQIKGMFIVSGNPVISGPSGAALDHALGSLELLVVIDLVQRESHRHADWILPDVHWLERAELQALLHSLFDAPFVQYGHKVVEPPEDCREAWQICVDLAMAMGRPMFGTRGFNGFVKATRRLAKLTGRPGLAFKPGWIEWALVKSGRRLKWKDIMAHPHGWLYAEKEYGKLEAALPEAHKVIGLAVPEFLAEARRLCATPVPVPPAEFPLQLIGRRRKDSMNSYLNENPGLHRRTRTNLVEIHPADAAPHGIADGDLVRVRSAVGEIVAPAKVSDAMRRGVIACEHGWGSGVYDPAGGAAPQRYGTNRNLLISNTELDPLSQSPGLNGAYVGIERVPETIAE